MRKKKTPFFILMLTFTKLVLKRVTCALFVHLNQKRYITSYISVLIQEISGVTSKYCGTNF